MAANATAAMLMTAALLSHGETTEALDEGLAEMELSEPDATDGDVDMDHAIEPLLSHHAVCADGDSDDQERGYVVVEAAVAALCVGDSRPPPPPPLALASLPPDCTTQDLVARVNAMAAKVDALSAFVVSRVLEDRMLSERLRRLEDAERLRSECVLIDQVSAAQVDTIKRVFEIELITSERQVTNEFDLTSPENAPYAWLAGPSTHDPIQVQGYMQFLRARLAPCLDACGLKLVDVRGRDGLLAVPLSVWSEFQLSGSAHLAIMKRSSQWPVDLNELVVLVNVFGPGEQDFSRNDDNGGKQRRQWIDDLAATQLFATDAIAPGCWVILLNTDLVAGWGLYCLTSDSHSVRKCVVRQPQLALKLLDENIRIWTKVTDE